MANRPCFPIFDQGSHGLVTGLGQAYKREVGDPPSRLSAPLSLSEDEKRCIVKRLRQTAAVLLIVPLYLDYYHHYS